MDTNFFPAYDPRLQFLEVFQEPDIIKHMDFKSIQEKIIKPLNLVFYKNGMTATVAVVKQKQYLTLSTDGKVDSSSHGELMVRSALAQLPLLLVPECKKAMVIGLGAGATASAALTHPLEELQIIEIEKAVADVYPLFFRELFPGLDTDPRAKIIINDAKFAIQQAKDLDVIISQSSHPWRTGSSRLFTVEFWKDCRKALKKNGIFAQWVQLYQLSPNQFKSILASFSQAFPHQLLFHFGENVILLGSSESIIINQARLIERWQEPNISEHYKQLKDRDFKHQTPQDLLSHLKGGTSEIARISDNALINTQDQPHIEFEAPLELLDNYQSELHNLLNTIKLDHQKYLIP